MYSKHSEESYEERSAYKKDPERDSYKNGEPSSSQTSSQPSDESIAYRGQSLEKEQIEYSERSQLLQEVAHSTSQKMNSSSESGWVNRVEDGNHSQQVWHTDQNFLKESMEKEVQKGDRDVELVGRDRAVRELAGAISENCKDPLQKKFFKAISNGFNPRYYGLSGQGEHLSDLTVESVARMATGGKESEQRIFDALQRGKRPELSDMRKDVGTSLDEIWRRDDVAKMEQITSDEQTSAAEIEERSRTESDNKKPEIRIIEKVDQLSFTKEELKEHLRESREKVEKAESPRGQKEATLEEKLKLQRDKLTDRLQTSPEIYTRDSVSEGLGMMSDLSALDLVEQLPTLEDAEYPVSHSPKNRVEAKKLGEGIKKGVLFGRQIAEQGRHIDFEQGENVKVTDNRLKPEDQLRKVILVSFARETEVEKAIEEANNIKIEGVPFSEALKKTGDGKNVPVFILSGQQILGFHQDGKILPLSGKYWLGTYGGSDDPLVGTPSTDLPPGTYVVDLRKGSSSYGEIFSAPEGHRFGMLSSNTWKSVDDVRASGEYGVYFSMRSPTRVEGFQQDIKEQGLVVLRVPEERNMMPMKVSEKPLIPGGYTTDEAFKIGLALQKAEQYIPEARREAFRNMLYTIPEQLLWALTGSAGLMYGLAKMVAELGEATAIARSSRTQDQIKMAAQRYARVFGDAQAMAAITAATVAATIVLKIGISKVTQARYVRTVRRNLGRAQTERMSIGDVAEGSALEDVTPRVRQPEVRAVSDTQSPGVIVDEGAQGHARTQRATAVLKDATDGQVRAAKGRRPQARQRPLGGDLTPTLKYGERGPRYSNPEPYPHEVLNRLGDDPQTIQQNQYILRKAGFTKEAIKEWIGSLDSQAQQGELYGHSAEQAVSSQVNLEINLIKHMKERYNLSWAEVISELERAGSDFEHVIDSIQLYEENTRFNKYIRQAEINKELPRFATTVESFERGQAIFKDICQRSGSEALKYASDLLDYWSRAGLRYMRRHSL